MWIIGLESANELLARQNPVLHKAGYAHSEPVASSLRVHVTANATFTPDRRGQFATDMPAHQLIVTLVTLPKLATHVEGHADGVLLAIAPTNTENFSTRSMSRLFSANK